MSCMSQNFRLFHVSNLSVRNFRIFAAHVYGVSDGGVTRGGGDDEANGRAVGRGRGRTAVHSGTRGSGELGMVALGVIANG